MVEFGVNLLWMYFLHSCQVLFRFKSPGPVDSNYAGPWQNALPNNPSGYSLSNFISYPQVPGIASGYVNSVQTVIYDEKRQALYSLRCQQAPDWAQSMRIYLMISRDNGQSWSNPFYISNCTLPIGASRRWLLILRPKILSLDGMTVEKIRQRSRFNTRELSS